MELNPVITKDLDVIQGAGAVGMTGYLNFLSGSERFKNLLTTTSGQCFELLELRADINLRISRSLSDLFDLLFEFDQGFLKLEKRTAWHCGSGE